MPDDQDEDFCGICDVCGQGTYEEDDTCDTCGCHVDCCPCEDGFGDD